MKTIGIIGAMEEEVASLQKKIEVVAVKSAVGLQFYVGKYAGNSVIVVKSGIGKVNAAVCTQALIDLFGVDYVINIGVAGAVSDELHICDILISKDAMQHDMDTTAFGDPIGVIPRLSVSSFPADEELIALAKQAAEETEGDFHVMVGRVASGDQFISTQEGRDRIRKNVKGDCAEMEGAAIAHACWLNRIPFVIIRAISDSANEEAGMSFDKFCQVAAERGSDIVFKMLEKM